MVAHLGRVTLHPATPGQDRPISLCTGAAMDQHPASIPGPGPEDRTGSLSPALLREGPAQQEGLPGTTVSVGFLVPVQG